MPRRALLPALLGLVLLAGLLVGGPPRLLVTTGTSMQPAFRAGDLAVLLPSDDYAVGDVAAYRSAVTPGTTVLHRVIAVRPDGRLQLQGDSNSWVDPDQPGPDAMVGELLLRVPRGGTVLGLLTGPRALVVLALALALVGRRPVREAVRRGARRGVGRPPVSGVPRGTARPTAEAPWRTLLPAVLALLQRVRPALAPLLARLPGNGRTAAVVAAVVAVLGVVATAALVLLPGAEPPPRAASAAAPAPAPSLAEGQLRRISFGYAADVRPSRAYDRPRAQAPLPVFRRLGNRVEVHVDYRGTPGTMRVDAVLSMSNGWRAVAPMTDPEPFTGTRHDEVVWLDLEGLERRMRAVVADIGLPPDALRVDVVPTVESEGTSWSPALALQLDETQLRLVDGPDSLVFHDDGTRGVARQAGGAVPVPIGSGGPTAATPAPAPPSAATAPGSDGPDRSLLLRVLLPLAAGLAVVGVLALRERRPGGGVLRGQADLLLPVAPLPLPAGAPVVEVADVSALVRLAERYGLLVLHWEQDGTEVFLVQDERATYRVQRPPPVAVPAPRAAPARRTAARRAPGSARRS